MTAELYVKRVGDGPAVILLHGLFGAGANLGSLARALQDRFSVFSVDMPSHGRSGWLQKPDLPGMASRICQWMEQEKVPTAHWVGHSLGGKVAMQVALQSPSKVASLVVADIAPVTYAPHHDAVFAALAAVDGARCDSREEAARRMADYLQEDDVIQFLLSSLQRDAHGVCHWRFDLHGIRAAYADLVAAPGIAASYDGPVLFIKGGESDYIQDRHWVAVQQFFPLAFIKVMPGCGHWLHAQKPQLFNGLVTRFLASVEQRKLSAYATGKES